MRQGNRHGYSLIEMMIALFLALIVVLALGKLITANQRSWAWGRDKAELQANTTEALEWMARSIRSANTLTLTGADEFNTFDQDGTLLHTYRLGSDAGETRVLEDDRSLVARRCTHFVVDANEDTTSLTLSLELVDRAGNHVAGFSRATVRNQTLEF
jgi:prepilin-type N-terminal cleavage/methylation domain-containing protein